MFAWSLSCTTALSNLKCTVSAASVAIRLLFSVDSVMRSPCEDAPMPKAPSADGESGRGLQIVSALSYVWGWSPIEGNGKAVWAGLKSAG